MSGLTATIYWCLTGLIPASGIIGYSLIRKRQVTVGSVRVAVIALVFGPLTLVFGLIGGVFALGDWVRDREHQVIFKLKPKRDMEAEIAALKLEIENLTK